MKNSEKLYKVYHRNYKSIHELFDDLCDAVLNLCLENNRIIIHYNADTLEIEPCQGGYQTYLNGKREECEWEHQDIYSYALEFVHEQRKDLTEFELNDTSITHITNKGITYSDGLGRKHFISYEDCAMNGSTASCVAERDSTKWCFNFYSSSVPIKVVFRSLFVYKKGERFLVGGKRKRFEALRQAIIDSGYTTYDLS